MSDRIEQSTETDYTCICSTYCQDDREAMLAPGDSLCVFCQELDPYDPCPAIGYGCWPTCGDDEEPCCTPEQRANAAKAFSGGAE